MKNFDPKVPSQKIIFTQPFPTVKPIIKSTNQLQVPPLPRQKQETNHENNGLMVKLNYQRYLRLSNICLIMIGFQMVLCFTYYQLDHMENGKSDMLLIFAYSLHCLKVVLRLFIEKVRFQSMQIIEKCDYNFDWQILKILFSFPLYPLPWLHRTTISVYYTQNKDLGIQGYYPLKLNYLIIIVSILHSAIVAVRILILNTVYYSPRAQRIGKIYQISQHGALYAVKCIIKDNPISTFGTVSCLMWIFCTFAMKITEADVPIDGNKFQYYQNCFWFIGITFTTVGYGDISPVSSLGHILVCLCCVWSTFNISVVTFLLVTNLSLKQHEHKSLQLLKNVDNTLQRKKISGQYIRIAVWRLWLNKKYKLNYVQTLKEKKLKAQLNNMRVEKKKCINVNDLTEQMQNQFDNALINVDYLHQNNKNLLDYISNKVILLQSKRAKSQRSLNEAKISEDQHIPNIPSMVSIKRNISSQGQSEKSIEFLRKQSKESRRSNQNDTKHRRSNFYEQKASLLKEKRPPIYEKDQFVEDLA